MPFNSICLAEKRFPSVPVLLSKRRFPRAPPVPFSRTAIPPSILFGSRECASFRFPRVCPLLFRTTNPASALHCLYDNNDFHMLPFFLFTKAFILGMSRNIAIATLAMVSQVQESIHVGMQELVVCYTGTQNGEGWRKEGGSGIWGGVSMELQSFTK